MTGLYIDVVCYSVLYTIFTILFFSNLNLSRIKRTTVEISVLILSCVILGLNPVLPVLLYFIFLISRFVTLYGWILPNKIHTYIHQRRSSSVDFTNATVVGPIRKTNRSNNCCMVCAGQRHLSHQPTGHRPITVRHFRDA